MLWVAAAELSCRARRGMGDLGTEAAEALLRQVDPVRLDRLGDPSSRLRRAREAQLGTLVAAEVARLLHETCLPALFDLRETDAAPAVLGVFLGAGDENRTRTVSLGS